VTPTAPKLDRNLVPKFVNQLERLPVWIPRLIKDANGKVIRKEFDFQIAKFKSQQLPPGFPATNLFGYGGNTTDAFGQNPGFRRTSPGPTFEQTRNVQSLVRYDNELLGRHPLAVDPTLDWANPNNFPKPSPPFLPFPPGYDQAQEPIAHVTHTHGIEVLPHYDGTPDLWFTANGIVGPEFFSTNYVQPVSNESSAFWYHDHTFGTTRLNVGMGLSGFWIERDPNNPLDQPTTPLPTGEFEVPLVVQDRSYGTDGSVFYPIAQDQPPGTLGANPDVNPYWMLIVNNDMNLVNGKVWPNMNVKPHAYRFRLLNSSNIRFYRFSFEVNGVPNSLPATLIGTDGGYKRTPQVVTSWRQGVTERVDFLLDFSKLAPGTKVVMRNTEQLNPPVGPAPDPNNDGLVMQFTVQAGTPAPPKPLPATLNSIATLSPNRDRRILIQNVEQDDQGRILQAELDGQLFHELTTELPTVGSTDDWDFVNLTPLDHNKHVHLIEFQAIERHTFDTARYLADWLRVNGNPPFDHPTLKLRPEPYFTSGPIPPNPEENAWKDTIQTPAGQVTKIRIRWSQQADPTGVPAPGVNDFPFDPTLDVGFVWHCHLIEHEDNEMMRPMTVIPIWKAGVNYPVGFNGNPGINKGLVDYQGVDYKSRVAHTSVANQPPPTRPDLWERINNKNGDWAAQTIYNVGDRVFFPNESQVWRALVKHQANADNAPPNPRFWARIL